MSKGFFYVATPYTHHPDGREMAFREACRVTAAIRRAGVDCFSPIAHWHSVVTHGGPVNDDDTAAWMAINRPFMDAASGIIVAKMPGWLDSKGVQAEIEHFRRAGKSVLKIDAGLAILNGFQTGLLTLARASDDLRKAPIEREDHQGERLVPRHIKVAARPIVLGLVGPSGGGKTTVCDRLKNAHGFTHFHVAEPVKRMFQALTGLGPEYCERPLIERPLQCLGDVTPRQVLEHIGTELHNIAPLTLPLAAEERIGAILAANPSARIIVDGIRRVSEAYAVRKLGGQVIRIAGRPVDESKPCDITQAEVIADHEIDFMPDIGLLHRQIDGVVARVAGADSATPTGAFMAKTRLTPDEREAMWAEQRQSFARGNAAVDRDGRSADAKAA